MDIRNYLKEHTPVAAPLVGFPGVHLNNTTIKQNIFNSTTQIDTLLKINEKFNPDILITIMDLTVESHALGAPVIYADMESPSVREHILHDEDEIEDIKKRFSVNNERVKVFTETVAGVRAKLPQKAIAAYVAGPFTLAGLLMGANDIAMNTVLKREFVEKTVEAANEIIIEYAKALVAAGADMIIILEPTAVMLSPDMYQDFSGKWTKKFVDEVDTCTILHICGNTEHLISEMVKTGVDGLSLDTQVDFPKIAPSVPEDVFLIGNIDPVAVMCQESPEKVSEMSLNLRESMSAYSNFILSTGCDLPPEAPHENIEAFMAAGKKAL